MESVIKDNYKNKDITKDCNNETTVNERTLSKSHIENKTIDYSINNTTLNSELIIDEEESNESNEICIISKEFKEEIQKMVDKQFEKEFKRLKNEYDTKIEGLLKEQEKVFNKTEILKSKVLALERYLKYYCRKQNIDYQSLLND